MLPKGLFLVFIVMLSLIFTQSTNLYESHDLSGTDESKFSVNMELVTTLNQIEQGVANIAWKADHLQVAVTFWESTKIQLLDGVTGEYLTDLRTPSDPDIFEIGIRGLVWSPDGLYLAIPYDKPNRNLIAIWNLDDNPESTEPILIDRAGRAPVLDWSPDSKILATAWGTDEERQLLFWDGATGELLHSQVIDKLAWIKWSPDGERYLTYAWESGPPVLWDAATHEQITSIPKIIGFKADSPGQIAWSAGGEVLIGIRCPDQFSACGLWRWYLPTNKVTEFVPADEERFLFFSRLAGSPDGELLAVTDSVKPVVYFFDMVSGELVGEMTGHTDVVRSLSWSSDGDTLATSDGVIRVWRINYK